MRILNELLNVRVLNRWTCVSTEISCCSHNSSQCNEEKHDNHRTEKDGNDCEIKTLKEFNSLRTISTRIWFFFVLYMFFYTKWHLFCFVFWHFHPPWLLFGNFRSTMFYDHRHFSIWITNNDSSSSSACVIVLICNITDCCYRLTFFSCTYLYLEIICTF